LLEVALKIAKEKQELVIFSTGKSKIIAEFFYFTLLEYGLKVHLFSSVYQLEAFDLTNKLVFIISFSGKNSKVNRYLKIIKKQQLVPTKNIIGISSTEEFMNKEEIGYHFFGNVSFFYTQNSRANPIFEKYPVLIILDLLSFLILKNLNQENQDFLDEIKTKNII
jgi:DNA-binding MurR/RpiR family transcriptional regulator